MDITDVTGPSWSTEVRLHVRGGQGVVTATVADLHDLEAKVCKAMSLRGARYLHVLVPCPLGCSDSGALVRLQELGDRTVARYEHAVAGGPT